MSENIIKKWIEFAQADLDAAKRLFQSPKPTSWTYLLTLWHCHQTIEKSLKMIIVSQDKELFKIHDLMRLRDIAGIALSYEQERFIQNLNKYYLKSRYPDIVYKPLPRCNKTLTKAYLQKTEKLFLWLKKQV